MTILRRHSVRVLRRWALASVMTALCLASSAQVSFSRTGGFYDHSFGLTLTSTAHEIRYTLDGSVPTTNSFLYTHPLSLGESLYSPANMFLEPNAPDDLFNPPEDVMRIVVIRAASFDEQGHRVGGVATHSYLVSELYRDPVEMPVVSITIDHSSLFDPDTGIFSLNGFDTTDVINTGNFNQHGREWERWCNVEFFEHDTVGFSQMCGIRCHGGYSRRAMQKPLKLYARKEYGTKNFDYPLFSSTSYKSYKRLVLRPFFSCFNASGLSDLLALRIAEPLRFASMASRPVVLFLNGEYWGIYFLQEAPDERFVEQFEDVDADDVNLLSSWYGEVENGSNSSFLKLHRDLLNMDLSDPLQYADICSRVDIDNFIDYFLFQIFVINKDWPGNNMRCYQFGSSPWRWIFFDGDGAFAVPDFDMVGLVTYDGPEYYPSSEMATRLFRSLLKNPDFKQQLGERMRELYRTQFQYARTSALLDEAADEISSEVGRQAERFGKPKHRSNWKASLRKMHQLLKHRPEAFLADMEAILGVDDSVITQFSAYPNPARGRIALEFDSREMGWMELQVYDSYGRLALSVPQFVKSGSNVCSLSLDRLAPGIYTLRVGSTGLVRRIVVL